MYNIVYMASVHTSST